jgi:hypothetical protein
MRSRIYNQRIAGMGGLAYKRLGALGVSLGLGLLLSACASTGVQVANAGTEQLAPVQTGSVSTSALPPIGPNGEVQGANQLPPVDSTTQVATANPGVSPVTGLPNSTGRDLSGGLTIEKLLGRWTVVSGADQCAINLTQTQKTGTSRYRASAPACPLKGLNAVSSWTVAGSQVQLFDESGNIIAALILSGNRFIGTLSGGQGISMVG